MSKKESLASLHHLQSAEDASTVHANQFTSLLVGVNHDDPTVDTSVNSKLLTNDPAGNIEDTKIGSFATLVVCSAAIGGFMFGYDTACISSILIFLDHSNVQLGPTDKEIVTGITSLGSLFGSLLAALFTGRFGRKQIITVCCIVFSLASIELGMSNSVASLIIGRLIVGFAVGAASMIVPVYISEIAPSKQRGSLLTLNSISTTGGQFIANLIAFLLKESKHNWRLMFFISGIPPIFFLMVVCIIPESPRFLLLKKKVHKAEYAISQLYPNATDFQVQLKIDSIKNDIEISKQNLEHSLYQRMFKQPSTMRALSVGVGLMFFQQATGFNSFMYYGATIFKTIGVGNPLIVSILISFTNFSFTFVALKFIDVVGRRKMLLNTVWIMVVSLLVASHGFSKAVQDPVFNVLSSNIINSIILIAAVLIFVASYASALGTIPWFSVEFLPLESRAPGSAIIASVGWLTNSVISISYLSLIEMASPSGSYIIFAIIGIIGWFTIYKWYPEVNGLSLEEIRHVFADGIDLNYAENIRFRKNLNK